MKFVQQKMSRACLMLCLVFGLATFAAACGDDSNGKCDEGQINAIFNGEEGCFDSCSSNDDCGEGQQCNTDVNACVPSSDTENNSTENNSTENNSIENNSTENNSTENNSTENNATPNPTNNNNSCNAQTVCHDYCNKLEVDCMQDQCSGSVSFESAQGPMTLSIEEISGISYDICMNGNTDMGITGCVAMATSDAAACQEAQDIADSITPEVCGELNSYYCGQNLLAGLPDFQNACGCEQPTTIGAGCAADEDCDGGALEPVCIPEDEGFYAGGLCTAYGCEVGVSQGQVFQSPDARCGLDNGWCFPLQDSSPEQPYGVCIAGCETNADCPRGPDEGWACNVAFKDDEGTNIGWCLDACNSNDDCSDDASGTVGRCNANSACEFECNPAEPTDCEDRGGVCEADGDTGFCVFN